MDIANLIKEHYKIGSIINVKNTAFGSGNNTFIIEAETGKYVAKLNSKGYEIEIYNLAQKQLLSSGINQPEIILTNSEQLMTSHGLVMYEYFEGETLEHFNKDMEEKALRYIYRYNQALKKVQIKESELLVQNDWDRIRSLDYVCNEVPRRIMDLRLDEKWKEILLFDIGLLNNYKEHLERLDKQIIHSDLGASNFLVLDGEISVVIDFSPDINNELYSLAHFIYWNYLWISNELNRTAIDNYLDSYYQKASPRVNNTDFYLLIFRATMFRTLGPLFEISHSEKQDYSKLSKRIKLLKWAEEELILR